MADLEADEYLVGYRRIPSWQRSPATEIDEQVAAGATCTACGHAGLVYRGYRREGSYLAFCICPSCDHCEEF